jgi:hypothetical protein
VKRLTLLLLPLLVACASPETYDSLGAKIAGGVLLTYVDGEPKDGTTTLVSAPLLTYRGTEKQPGYERSSTCFIPLLFHHEETRREVRVERAWEPGCPPDGDGWWEARERGGKPRKRPLTSKEKARIGITPSRPESKRSSPWTRERQRPKRPRTRSREEREQEAREDRELTYVLPSGPEASAGWRGRTLRLDKPGRILPHKYPSRATEISILWPLIKLASERPGRVAVDPDVGAAQVYEVGPDTTTVRFLPLFSHRRKGKHSQTILWPLLGFGWETTPKGSYVRLFYFLRFKVD